MSELLPPSISAATHAIQSTRLIKRFGNQYAVGGIDLGVPEGSFYLLAGPNGSGKTTTFGMILGLTRPTSGHVTVAGAMSGPDGIARARIGHVPETQSLGYPMLKVKDLIDLHSRYRPTWDRQYADSLAKMLEVRLDARAGKLSKGESRRVQLLLALAHRPEVLLLDEPTDGLDRIGRDLFQRLIIDHLAATPTTVLVASHVAYELEGLATDIGILRQGTLMTQVSRSDIQARLRTYEFTTPAGWRRPSDISAGRMDTSVTGARWTMWGNPDTIVGSLTASGAVVHNVSALDLDEATLALLTWGEIQ